MAGLALPTWPAGLRGIVVGLIAVWIGLLSSFERARAADPAVAFMEKVAQELLTASRSRSPAAFAGVIHRYADTGYIGSYSLGSYRQQLKVEDKPGYLSGMVRFIGRYAATEAPKYPVAGFKITGSLRGGQGIMVDSVVTLRDGSSYDVRWLLAKTGNVYRVRDAMVYGFWMTPFLKRLFENYIAENGGNVRALVVALNR
ncbi:MAG: ABC transporter substrate-binding protein [Hyphomicrobiaceae bacterium]|nr:ABC transporter substrate-binding protein [Hyphomicrobiaceae bacterium]